MGHNSSGHSAKDSSDLSIVFPALFLFVCVIAFLGNRDLFSPAKVFLVTFLIFHAGVIFDEVTYKVWGLMALVLLVGVISVFYELLRPHTVSMRLASTRYRTTQSWSNLVDKRLIFWIWILSVPAIASQTFMLLRFGGLEGYINILNMRVVEWRGYGWANTLISTMAALNLVYFSSGLLCKRSNRWILFGVHLIITLTLGVLAGSRSNLLNIFVMQLFAYHYLKRPIKLPVAVMLVTFLILVAFVAGVVREGIKIDDGKLTTGLDYGNDVLKVDSFYYGVKPLSLIAEAKPVSLAYGSTLVSLITNVVPRTWWPGKPDSGGVFFTKVYTDDEWGGSSNMTPTFLGEWIINFGFVAGCALYVLTYPALMFFVCKGYRRTIRRIRTRVFPSDAVNIVIYLCIMWAVIGLMVGEVTNVLLLVFLTKLIPLAAIKWLVFGKHRYPCARISTNACS